MDELPTIAAVDPSLPGNLELGAFSVSLSVADLDRSLAFYEGLGFEVVGGDRAQNYVIVKNGEAILGLFQGVFEGNILTFNPGLTGRMERVESFTDVRVIQRHLRTHGIELGDETDAAATGPAHITLVDPDGNAILIDQFFEAPGGSAR